VEWSIIVWSVFLKENSLRSKCYAFCNYLISRIMLNSADHSKNHSTLGRLGIISKIQLSIHLHCSFKIMFARNSILKIPYNKFFLKWNCIVGMNFFMNNIFYRVYDITLSLKPATRHFSVQEFGCTMKLPTSPPLPVPVGRACRYGRERPGRAGFCKS